MMKVNAVCNFYFFIMCPSGHLTKWLRVIRSTTDVNRGAETVNRSALRLHFMMFVLYFWFSCGVFFSLDDLKFPIFFSVSKYLTFDFFFKFVLVWNNLRQIPVDSHGQYNYECIWHLSEEIKNGKLCYRQCKFV